MMEKKLLIFFLLISSCSSGGVPPSKSATFSNYIKDIYLHNINIYDYDFYIIPLEVCRSCIISSLTSISSVKDSNLVLILSGNKHGEFIRQNDQIFSEHFSLVLYDKSNQLSKYDLGIFKPTLLKILPGDKSIKKLEIYEFDQARWDKTKNTLYDK